MTYLELYEQAEQDLEQSKITLGEYEERIKPLEEEIRKTGHWIDDEFGTRCSCCNIHTHLDKFGSPMRLLYCSFCGAKMEGE